VQASESHSWLSSAWRADWTAAVPQQHQAAPYQHQAAPDQHQGGAAVAVPVPAQHQGAAPMIQQAVAGACTHE